MTDVQQLLSDGEDDIYGVLGSERMILKWSFQGRELDEIGQFL